MESLRIFLSHLSFTPKSCNRSHCRTLSGSGGDGAAAFPVEAVLAVRSSLRMGGTKSDAPPLGVDCSCFRDSSLEFFLKGRDSLGTVSDSC